MIRYALLLALALTCCGALHAQGGNCEPPTPEELARMQEMRRSAVVAPVTEVRFGGSGFRGTNRKPVPTRRERELAARVDELEAQIASLLDELRQLKETAR